jgi:hypothetical protein
VDVVVGVVAVEVEVLEVLEVLVGTPEWRPSSSLDSRMPETVERALAALPESTASVAFMDASALPLMCV